VYDRTVGGAGAGAIAAVVNMPPPAGKRVLMLGAGLCAGPALELLSRERADHVTIVSAVEGEAAALCAAAGRPNLTPITLSASPADASSWKTVAALVAESDATLSLLPASMHAAVAELCVASGTPLVTASYVAADMEALHAAALEANVPLLCEMGLDPGLDHMSAVELIQRAHADGGRVEMFQSNCGGLPSPECASTTPLAYKFSWSPAGVMAATRNGARYLQDGMEVVVDGSNLLTSAVPLTEGRLGRTLKLEVLPNRDSLPYASIYGIEGEVHSIGRGTLRYAGWSALFKDFERVGLSSTTTPVPPGAVTWRQLLSSLGVEQSSVSAPAALASESNMLAALSSLDVWAAADEPVGEGHPSIAEAFGALLARKLGYGPTERDSCLMEHTMRVEYSDGRPAETLSSSLVSYGEAGGPSSMSRSVGLTAALGVKRVLASELPPLAGVLRPVEPSIYEFCLPRLAKEGFAFEESVERDAA